MASAELIEGLNHALNREVSTFLRYMLQGASIKGAQWAPAREMYLGEVTDEVGHALYLAEKIVMLGGTPKRCSECSGTAIAGMGRPLD
ncbi:MAG: ferritin-like domain-containing protein [Pirellulales bacterium]